MSFRKIMPLLIIIAFVVLGASFLPQILGTVEAGQSSNISQEYQDQINSTRSVSILTISISKFVGLIFAIVVLVLAILAIGKKIR